MADQVSDFGLKLNYWYLTNREHLRKWWVLVLLALDIFLLAATLTQGALLLFRFRDTSDVVGTVAASTQDVAQAEARVKPTTLVQGSAVVTPRGNQRYDFSLRLENPNTTWHAVVDVQFVSGSLQLTPVRVVLPPKTVRYALALNVQSESVPQATSRLESTTWTRLTPAEAAETFDVRATGITIGVRTLVTGDNQQRTVTQVTGVLQNSTLEAFEAIRIPVILTRGNATVGVGSTIISRIEAESSVPFSVEWNTVIPNVEKADVIPEVHRGLVAP